MISTERKLGFLGMLPGYRGAKVTAFGFQNALVINEKTNRWN